MQRFFFSLFLFLLFPLSIFAKTISPLDYGLLQAKTGEDRFQVLYQTHMLAKKNHWDVSYKGIRELKIEIPLNAKSIPLGEVTDFSDVTFLVTNTNKNNFFLFVLSQDLFPVSVPKKMFSSYDFRSIKELKHGNKILIVEDQNPWVENRAGYNYGAIRKDILLLRNGKALNKTISTYNNSMSKPSCKYAEVTSEQKMIKNIIFKRTMESTFKTFLVKVINMNNVLLQGIKITTPTPHNMTGDTAIGIYDCTNVFFEHVTIDQTYSKSDYYGYGINLNNVWNSWFDNIVSESAWGIFGNNNINTAHVSNSKINRFDVHCYGKDFYFSNCEFSQYGLPESAFIGELEFSNCIFRNAYVCVARSEYNAYSPFNIIIKDCDIYLNKQYRYLVSLGNISYVANNRKELKSKYSPGLHIINSRIILADDLSNWALIHISSKSSERPFNYIGDIIVDGLQVKGKDANLIIMDRPIRCQNSPGITLKRVNLIETDSCFLSLASKKNNYSPTIIFNINKDGNAIYKIIESRLNYSPLELPHYNVHFVNCSLGRIRYYNTKNGEVSARRRFENCKLYLNDIGTDNYTLDDAADYIGCTFIPINKKKKVIPCSMRKSSEIIFKNCSSDVDDLFGPNLPKSSIMLKSYKYKFK